jgi:hypothetical protein
MEICLGMTTRSRQYDERDDSSLNNTGIKQNE